MQWTCADSNCPCAGLSCAVLCCAVLVQGYAYVEFMEADAVDNAIMLDNQELRGRPIKVGGHASGFSSWDSCSQHMAHAKFLAWLGRILSQPCGPRGIDQEGF